LIRVLAEKLLLLHMTDKSTIESIVSALTEKLFNHSYKISRKEAADELRAWRDLRGNSVSP
jgi:hypothetical protein